MQSLNIRLNSSCSRRVASEFRIPRFLFEFNMSSSVMQYLGLVGCRISQPFRHWAHAGTYSVYAAMKTLMQVPDLCFVPEFSVDPKICHRESCPERLRRASRVFFLLQKYWCSAGNLSIHFLSPSQAITRGKSAH